MLNQGEPLSTSSAGLKRAFLHHLCYTQGKSLETATQQDLYQSLAYTVRDQLAQTWLTTTHYSQANASPTPPSTSPPTALAATPLAAPPATRKVVYLSAEFLIGPSLENHLFNLGITQQAQLALRELGLDLEALIQQEPEPGLGNGGLGRLAACFMESLATLSVPAIGYGIRYEYGFFHQTFQDGWQIENPDPWLRLGYPWEFPRQDQAITVKLGGHTEPYTDEQGRFRVRWVAQQTVIGVPFDTPISGYQVDSTHTLRLWQAQASEPFNFAAFNQGDYLGAFKQKIAAETLTKVLYPNDDTREGKILRLAQQYFFVSCSLQDMLRQVRQRGQAVTTFHHSFAVQLNDTHPAIGIAELMRLLVDESLLPWEEAWNITRHTFSYTNHTLLPEALERWPVEYLGQVLPRHLEIIYEINTHFLNAARLYHHEDEARLARLSLIDETGERYVRMAHLACVGSHAINGVADLHSELLKHTLLPDFYALWPQKFHSITNGVTPRRWVALSNPRLGHLITRCIGSNWIKDWSQIHALEAFADDSAFRDEWHAIKHANKIQLTKTILDQTGIRVNPDSLFDIQVKRIHEYKRQHLCALYIAARYYQLKSHANLEVVPRTFIFGGKAASGYARAKLMIKLITAIADIINHDFEVRDQLKVVFLPNYNVTLGQVVYPAAELSEQISLAGKEASGTGNMKFMMNGALTLGTLDGANIEIRTAVGEKAFFLFGLTAEEVSHLRHSGYRPLDYVPQDSELQTVLKLIQSGFFSPHDPTLFHPLIDDLLQHDPYMLLADYASYAACQNRVDAAYRNTPSWTHMSVLNTARSGRFSADRAIREYCDRIWHIQAV